MTPEISSACQCGIANIQTSTMLIAAYCPIRYISETRIPETAESARIPRGLSNLSAR